jgi:protein-arginine kinase activator protein McsA
VATLRRPLQQPGPYNPYELRRCRKCRKEYYELTVLSRYTCAACRAAFEYVELPDGSWDWQRRFVA